jgi:hypothetical protein
MFTRSIRLAAIVAVLTLGASSFIVPVVGACGGSQSSGSCKEATSPALDWLTRLRAIVSTLDALIP